MAAHAGLGLLVTALIVSGCVHGGIGAGAEPEHKPEHGKGETTKGANMRSGEGMDRASTRESGVMSGAKEGAAVSGRSIKRASILMLPNIHYGHVNFFSAYGNALLDHGHKVDVLVPQLQRHAVLKHGLNPISPQSTEFDSFEQLARDAGLSSHEPQNNLVGLASVFSKTSNFTTGFCRTVLTDAGLMSTMRGASYDLVIVDGVIFFRCLYIIPHMLGIPYVTLNAMLDAWNSGILTSPAVEPAQVLPLNNRMGFLQRLGNTLITFGMKGTDPLISDDSLLEEFVPDGGVFTFRELYQKSEMWLLNFDQWCIDYPRVTAPHYQMLSGATGYPPKALEGDVADFVNGAQHGVIVLSFGSLPFLSDWKREKADMFMSVFSRLKERVIIRYTGEKLESVPSNVLIKTWLPQNDLLGHKKTKLFITHGGNNGQLEGVYHGVPMLAFPMGGDQLYNAEKLKAHGYGEALEFHTFTADQLYDKIQMILNDKSYKERVQKCSDIWKDLGSPKEKFSFWINHILKFGGAHLRPPNFDLSVPQLFLWDVLLFLLVVLLICVVLLYCACRCCIRRCCCRKSENKQKHE